MDSNVVTLNTDLREFQATNANLTDWYQPFTNAVYQYYPSWGCWREPSKIEQSFKIVGKLMEKKLISLKTVDDFVKTVNEIAQLL